MNSTNLIGAEIESRIWLVIVQVIKIKIVSVSQTWTFWVWWVLQQRTKALLSLTMYMFNKHLLTNTSAIYNMHKLVVPLIYSYMMTVI